MTDTKKTQIITEVGIKDNWIDMLDKYLAKDVKRHWTEDFVNEENGEVKTIDRYETVAVRGTHVDAELLQELTFLLTSQDIKSVFVSNQQRRGFEVTSERTYPCIVTASLNGKKRNFFLYANTLHIALEIAADYIELNFDNRFALLKAKFIDSYVFISHTPAQMQNKEEDDDKKIDICYYKIEAIINRNEIDQHYTFVLMANDIDDAKNAIERYISLQLQKEVNEGKITPDDVEFHVTILSGQKFNIYDVIDREFSMAYCTNE